MDENFRDLEIAVKAATKAAELIREKTKFDSEDINISNKDVNDFVTNVDKASEELIINELKKATPDYDILAEESGEDIKDDDRPKWIIDPIDGTTNFMKGIPVYAVSIGLEIKGEIVAGTVYNVPMNEVFTAVKGKGAYLNNRKIRVSNTTDPNRLIIGTGFPFKKNADYTNYMNLFEILTKNTAGLRRPGSASIDLCWTACGRYDAFYEFGLHPWDVAAGIIIIKEAGGIISTTSGTDDYLYGRTILAANTKEVYDFIMGFIKKYYYRSE